MKDINGGELRAGGAAMLLCEVLAIDDAEGVRLRVMNSDLEILVRAKHDEVLGGFVADSELTAFDPDLTTESRRAAVPRLRIHADLPQRLLIFSVSPVPLW